MPESDFTVTALYSISLPAQSPALWPVLRTWRERIFTALLTTKKKQVCKQNSEPGSSSSSIIINLRKSTYCIVFQFPQQCNVDNNSSFNNILELLGIPCVSAGKESTCNVGNLGLIPGLGRSPAEGKVYPFQYSGLENSMDCIGHGVVKTQTQLSDFHSQSYCKEQKARTKIFFPKVCSCIVLGFPGGSVLKNPPAKKEMWVWSLCREDHLEKEMSTHSSILAWKMPWTGEPGGLQSICCKRVKHDSDLTHTHKVCNNRHLQGDKVIILLSSDVGRTQIRTRLLIRVHNKNKFCKRYRYSAGGLDAGQIGSVRVISILALVTFAIVASSSRTYSELPLNNQSL